MTDMLNPSNRKPKASIRYDQNKAGLPQGQRDLFLCEVTEQNCLNKHILRASFLVQCQVHLLGINITVSVKAITRKTFSILLELKTAMSSV